MKVLHHYDDQSLFSNSFIRWTLVVVVSLHPWNKVCPLPNPPSTSSTVKYIYYGVHSLLKDKRIGTNDECMIVLKDLFFPGFVMDAHFLLVFSIGFLSFTKIWRKKK